MPTGYPKTLEEVYRIFDSIEPDEFGCHNYPSTFPGRKIQINVNGKWVYAHRVALERKLGRPIRPGYFACHHCDWPSCVKQDHLYEGTAIDNARDAIKRGEKYVRRMMASSEELAYSQAQERRNHMNRLRGNRWTKWRKKFGLPFKE